LVVVEQRVQLQVLEIIHLLQQLHQQVVEVVQVILQLHRQLWVDQVDLEVEQLDVLV
tara:strand:+ start:929 stop:1099 length:171 start_codon:yes stop_codon:yes gene_type:complete